MTANHLFVRQKLFFKYNDNNSQVFRSNAKMNTSEMFAASGPENESYRVMAELGTFDRGWDLVTTLSYLVMSLSEYNLIFSLNVKQRKDLIYTCSIS